MAARRFPPGPIAFYAGLWPPRCNDYYWSIVFVRQFPHPHQPGGALAVVKNSRTTEKGEARRRTGLLLKIQGQERPRPTRKAGGWRQNPT